jgi:multiple sugar transport system permease protein
MTASPRSAHRPRRAPRIHLGDLPRWATILLCIFAAIAPLYWLVTLATQTNNEIVSNPPQLLPNLDHFGGLSTQTDLPIGNWLFTSLLVGLGTAAVSVFIGTLAAFGLSRFDFGGALLFGFLIFAAQMMPAALLIVPLYSIFAEAKLIDNVGSLVLANSAFAMPVAIWIIKQAMDGVPRELDEAAVIDGAGSFAVLKDVVLPLTRPAIAAAGIIAFLAGWNDFLFANTFMVSTENWTATKGLASFFGQYSTPIDLIMASAVLFALPPIIFFLLLQRQIVNGLTAGAVKG